MAEDTQLDTPPEVQTPVLSSAVGSNLSPAQIARMLATSKGAVDTAYAQLPAAQDKIRAATEAMDRNMREKEQAMSAVAQRPTPEYSPGKMPEAPQFGMKQEEVTKMISMVTALSALGGMVTRRPLTAMLNNFSAGVQGYVQGNLEAYRMNMTQFKANFEKAKAANEEEWRKTQQIMEKNKGDLQATLADLKIEAARDGRAVDLATLEKGDVINLIKMRENEYHWTQQLAATVERAVLAAQNQAENRADRRAIAEQAHQDRVAALLARTGPSGTDDPALIKMLADKWRQGDPSALTGLGYGTAAANLRKQVLQQAARDAEAQGQTGADLAGQRAGYQADASSLRQYQNYVNRVEALGSKIDKDITTLFTVAKKGVGPTQMPIFDKWLQMGRKAAGDPDVSAFETQIQTVKNEYGRAMSGPASNAQLHTSAMKHADELINSAQNMEQLQASVKMMRQDIKNQTDVANEQITAIKGRLSGKQSTDQPRTFATEAEAAAAGLAPGTKVIVGGVPGTWR